MRRRESWKRGIRAEAHNQLATEMTEEFFCETAVLRSDEAKDFAIIHDVQVAKIPHHILWLDSSLTSSGGAELMQGSTTAPRAARNQMPA